MRSHCFCLSLMDRCLSFSLSGFSGLPPLFFGCSMATVYVMQKGVDKRMVCESQ